MIQPLEDDIPTSVFLANLSQEIGRLSDVAAELDDLLANIVSSNAGATVDHMAGLQSVDALRQALDAIAKITDSAVRTMPKACDCGFARAHLSQGVTIQAVLEACLAGADTDARSAVEKASAAKVQNTAHADILFLDD